MRVPVNPKLIQWACDRADLDVRALSVKLPKLEAWLSGEFQPTFKQLEDLARRTHAPIGFFFLQEPPVETIPIPDFRTVAGKGIARPSPDVLDTIYICQQRQEWYREYARSNREPQISFVGSASCSLLPEAAAAEMREALAFSVEERRGLGTWRDALNGFIAQAEAIGVLVMINGVVGSNNTRKLDPAEFRGFALSDPLAPLVFINGSDTLSAKMFTLAHELAHLWLGETALSDVTPRAVPTHEVERWCNQVAAELLVPMDALMREYRPTDNLLTEVERLARRFKVSRLVILRRIHDAGQMSRPDFWAAYDEEVDRLRAIAASSSGGGNFYHTTTARVGKRFARAITGSALEGRASFTEALRLLGIKRMATFKDLGRAVGVEV